MDRDAEMIAYAHRMSGRNKQVQARQQSQREAYFNSHKNSQGKRARSAEEKKRRHCDVIMARIRAIDREIAEYEAMADRNNSYIF